jgi:ABC-type sugar transport system substrate-binding protein
MAHPTGGTPVNRSTISPRRRRGAFVTTAALATAALAMAGCSSASSSAPAGSTASATSAAPAAASGSAAAASGSAAGGGTTCGTTVAVGPSNPGGVYATLSAKLKNVYSSYPYALNASPWASAKKVKGPWKVGNISFAINNPFSQDALTGLQREFAKAKAAGLVTGSLMTSIPATQDASTPEAQIAAIQQMVREGVNVIIMAPVGGASEAAAVDAAGKAGVPVILADSLIQQSQYGLSVWSQNQVEADAGTLGLIKSGNILVVRGIAGNEEDDVLYNQAMADLKNCPDIHVASTIYGNWSAATAKTAVTQYLVSHPGQKISGVIQDGAMTPGIIEAFQAEGMSVPPISEGECQGGDLSWWLAHKDSYQTVGGCINGFQSAYTYFNYAMRVLNGNGAKYNVASAPAPTITNANLAEFATPGLPLTSSAEQKGPDTAWCDDTCLDQYFTTPGAPGGL